MEMIFEYFYIYSGMLSLSIEEVRLKSELLEQKQKQ